jgi:E3 ubiquitin-protein ligase SHPRH
MMLWFKAHRNCPVCKKDLKTSNLHDITFNPQQLQVRSDNPDQAHDDTEKSPQQNLTGVKKTGIYSEFNSDKLAEIQNIELDGPSFTTKVDTLVKHLMWLRESDPGAKSIVFSQYKGFLEILKNAFSRFGIGHTSIVSKMMPQSSASSSMPEPTPVASTSSTQVTSFFASLSSTRRLSFRPLHA